MTIQIAENESSITAKLNGQVTELDGKSVKQAFDKLASASHKKVNLDFGLVPDMATIGIAKLLVLSKRLKQQKRELVISEIHEKLFSQFTSFGMDKMLTIDR